MSTDKIRVNIDVETRSTCDLRKTSAKIYAAHPSTELIVVRYGEEREGAEVHEWDCLLNPQIPAKLYTYLADRNRYLLVAHNAGFEQAILSAARLRERHGLPPISQDQWDDTAARAARMGLPRALEGAAKALGLNVSKDMEGARVMMQLCKPRAYDEDDNPIWWDREEFAAKYERLSEYCAVDVNVGMALSGATKPLPERERAIWLMTEEINSTGLYVDWKFAEAAHEVAKTYLAYLDTMMKVVTGGAVSGSRKVTELKRWCRSKGYVILDDDEPEKELLDKGAIARLLEDPTLPEDVRSALEIRRAAAKSSVAKYEAILNRVDRETGRVPDTLMYHGASTGRWAGVGIQPQNFPRDTVKDWEATAADVYKVRDRQMTFEQFEDKHGPVMDVLSKMLRGTIRAPEGRALIYADYSAVEARGVAWLAGADTLTALFASGGKVYEEFASSVYGIPASEVGKDSPERFLAKTAVLGAGYGMGKTKFRASCQAQGKDVSEDQAAIIIQGYRTQYPEIPALWKGIEAAAIAAVQSPGKVMVYQGKPTAPKIEFCVKGKFLLMRLPDGTLLHYTDPRIVRVATPFGDKQALEFSTVNSLTKKWERKITWGGHLTENAVQAICRNIIAGAMLELRRRKWKLVGTVHDEVIVETKYAAADTDMGANVSTVLDVITTVPEWAKGFPLGAEAKWGIRYGK